MKIDARRLLRTVQPLSLASAGLWHLLGLRGFRARKAAPKAPEPTPIAPKPNTPVGCGNRGAAIRPVRPLPAPDRGQSTGDAGDKDDSKDEADPHAMAARKRERARCAAIIGHPLAAPRVTLAVQLALGTDMTRTAAIAVLRAAAGAASGAARPANASRSWDRAARRAGLDPAENTPKGQKR